MPNTSGAFNLGALSANGGDDKPTFEGLSQQDREDLEALAAQTGTGAEGRPVQAMFLIVIPAPGEAVAYQDVTVAEKYSAHHQASVPEMLAAVKFVADRISDSMLSQAVVTTQMQMAAAMQRQAEDAQLRSQLKLN